MPRGGLCKNFQGFDVLLIELRSFIRQFRLNFLSCGGRTQAPKLLLTLKPIKASS